MLDAISPLVNLALPWIIGAATILLGLFMWGKKKMRQGRLLERKCTIAAMDAETDKALENRRKSRRE